MRASTGRAILFHNGRYQFRDFKCRCDAAALRLGRCSSAAQECLAMPRQRAGAGARTLPELRRTTRK